MTLKIRDVKLNDAIEYETFASLTVGVIESYSAGEYFIEEAEIEEETPVVEEEVEEPASEPEEETDPLEMSEDNLEQALSEELGGEWNSEGASFDLYDPEPLEAYIKSISVQGLAEIEFSVDIYLTSLLTNVNQTRLIECFYITDSDNTLTKYEVIDLTKKNMEIQLYFEDPMKVSQDIDRYDQLQVIFTRP